MNRLGRVLLLFLVAWPTVARGEIFKQAVFGQGSNELCFLWWPVLPPTAGWTHDEEASRQLAVNVMVPIGKTFENAPAVMYGRALYKPGDPETRSIADVIANDRADTEENVPGVRIRELPALLNGDGQRVRCLSFSPPSSGNWEMIAYSEEGDFWLLIAVSAKSRAALATARPAFEQLVGRYKAGP